MLSKTKWNYNIEMRRFLYWLDVFEFSNKTNLKIKVPLKKKIERKGKEKVWD